jgi:hypothetical protein
LVFPCFEVWRSRMQLSAKGETLNVSEQERFFDDALSWAL